MYKRILFKSLFMVVKFGNTFRRKTKIMRIFEFVRGSNTRASNGRILK